MELLIVICNLVQFPLVLITIVWLTGIIIAIATTEGWVLSLGKKPNEPKRDKNEKADSFHWKYREYHEEMKKWNAKIVWHRYIIGWVVFLFVTTASFFPSALISARVQMIKLEITDPGIRQEVYSDIDRIFKKLEKKYLGSSSSEEKKSS